MPLVVRELVIRATVEKSGEERRAETGGKKAGKPAVVRECVDQVMEILRNREER